MATQRPAPYIWVTWIRGLIAGDDHCQWKAWFMAHHKFAKRPSDFDLATWAADHAVLVDRRAQELRDQGYVVRVEGENSLNVVGQTGITLAAKPDIVAAKGRDVVVVDCKTGQQRNGDVVQVLIYMVLLPAVRMDLVGATIRGEVQYSDFSVPVPAGAADTAFRSRLGEVVTAVGGEKAPVRNASFSECRFCDITAEDCGERVESATRAVETDLF